MDLTRPTTALWISRAAWVAAVVGTVGGQLHAVARSLSHPGDWTEDSLNRAWQEPLSRALSPLFDWSDPWTVYVTYGKLWAPVCLTFTLAAFLVYQRRRPTGLERRLWQVVLGAHVLMTVSVIGDYYTPQLMDVMFLVGVAAMLVIGLGGMALGGLLLRRGFRPRLAAGLLISFFPGFFLITEITSMGSTLLPLAWGWAIAAHGIARERGPERVPAERYQTAARR